MSSKRAHRLQISPDPQNLSWTSDKSSFGYKMMQKMGWTEGKGLGTNEDGNTDHIKIAKKIDNRGNGHIQYLSQSVLSLLSHLIFIVLPPNIIYTILEIICTSFVQS